MPTRRLRRWVSRRRTKGKRGRIDADSSAGGRETLFPTSHVLFVFSGYPCSPSRVSTFTASSTSQADVYYVNIATLGKGQVYCVDCP